jgi:hypothetical protein
VGEKSEGKGGSSPLFGASNGGLQNRPMSAMNSVKYTDGQVKPFHAKIFSLVWRPLERVGKIF